MEAMDERCAAGRSGRCVMRCGRPSAFGRHRLVPRQVGLAAVAAHAHVGLLAVTSADRLNAGWTAAQRARERGLVHAQSHIERLLGDLPPNCALVTVVDGHPASLMWLGAVHGHRTRGLGVEHFGQTGTIGDLYRHYGIDAEGIMRAAQAMSPGRPMRNLRVV